MGAPAGIVPSGDSGQKQITLLMQEESISVVEKSMVEFYGD